MKTVPRKGAILEGMTEEERQDVKVRLASKVWHDPETGCHVWTGSASPHGYGVIRIRGKVHRATRVAYELAHGPIPDGQIIRHRCHFPPCINQAHLIGGDPADNAQDMEEAGRGTRKLTDSDVVTILGLLMLRQKQDDIAAEFGITQQTVSDIRSGRSRVNAADREVDRALAAEAA